MNAIVATGPAPCGFFAPRASVTSLVMYDLPHCENLSQWQQFTVAANAPFCTFCHSIAHREMCGEVVGCPSKRMILKFRFEKTQRLRQK